jgi:hypothetical protein
MEIAQQMLVCRWDYLCGLEDLPAIIFQKWPV